MRTYPFSPPRVLDDPVLVAAGAGVGAVPDHSDGVVDSGVAGGRQHPALVVLEGDGVDGHDDRLLRHSELQRGLAVGRNSRAAADPAHADPAAPALPLLALVGVLPRGGEAAVARDPPHGRRGIAAVAAVVGRGRAVHELLLREGDETARPQLVQALDRRHRGERPARACNARTCRHEDAGYKCIYIMFMARGQGVIFC